VTAIQLSGQNSTTPIKGYADGSGASPLSTGPFSSSATVGNMIVGLMFSNGGSNSWSAGNPSGMTIPVSSVTANSWTSAAEYVLSAGTNTTCSVSFGYSAANIIGVVIQ